MLKYVGAKRLFNAHRLFLENIQEDFFGYGFLA